MASGMDFDRANQFYTSLPVTYSGMPSSSSQQLDENGEVVPEFASGAKSSNSGYVDPYEDESVYSDSD